MKVAWKTELGHVRNNNEDARLIDEEKGNFLLKDNISLIAVMR